MNKERSLYWMNLLNFLFGSIMAGFSIIIIYSMSCRVFTGIFFALIFSSMYFHYLMQFNPIKNIDGRRK